MNWSIVDYMAELDRRSKRCRGRNEQLEREMLRLFPPLESELVSAPCVVVDSEGRVILWYLPGLLGRKCQVRKQIITSQLYHNIDNLLLRVQYGIHWQLWNPDLLLKSKVPTGGTIPSISTRISIGTSQVL